MKSETVTSILTILAFVLLFLGLIYNPCENVLENNLTSPEEIIGEFPPELSIDSLNEDTVIFIELK